MTCGRKAKDLTSVFLQSWKRRKRTLGDWKCTGRNNGGNVPNLAKELNIFGKLSKPQGGNNLKKSVPSYIIVKFLRTNDKFQWYQISHQKLWRLEGSGRAFFSSAEIRTVSPESDIQRYYPSGTKGNQDIFRWKEI